MEMLATLAGQHANAKDSVVERTKNKRNPRRLQMLRVHVFPLQPSVVHLVHFAGS